jgi:hypothetical protein
MGTLKSVAYQYSGTFRLLKEQGVSQLKIMHRAVSTTPVSVTKLEVTGDATNAASTRWMSPSTP